jgi:hypothetical protein
MFPSLIPFLLLSSSLSVCLSIRPPHITFFVSLILIFVSYRGIITLALIKSAGYQRQIAEYKIYSENKLFAPLISLAYKIQSVKYSWPQNVQRNPQYYQLRRFWIYMSKFLTILKTLYFQCRFLLPPSVSIRKQQKLCQHMLPTFT